MRTVDLRSDTTTLPTDEMRQAIAESELGDDVFQGDPTVNKLQDLAAQRMGKEAALLVPSGTMANLASILTHCGRGAEVILGNRAHTYKYEKAVFQPMAVFILPRYPTRMMAQCSWKISGMPFGA